MERKNNTKIRRFSTDRFISSSNNIKDLLTENFFKKDEENSEKKKKETKTAPDLAKITKKTYIELLKNNIFQIENKNSEKEKNFEKSLDLLKRKRMKSISCDKKNDIFFIEKSKKKSEIKLKEIDLPFDNKEILMSLQEENLQKENFFERKNFTSTKKKFQESFKIPLNKFLNNSTKRKIEGNSNNSNQENKENKDNRNSINFQVPENINIKNKKNEIKNKNNKNNSINDFSILCKRQRNLENNNINESNLVSQLTNKQTENFKKSKNFFSKETKITNKEEEEEENSLFKIPLNKNDSKNFIGKSREFYFTFGKNSSKKHIEKNSKSQLDSKEEQKVSSVCLESNPFPKEDSISKFQTPLNKKNIKITPLSNFLVEKESKFPFELSPKEEKITKKQKNSKEKVDLKNFSFTKNTQKYNFTGKSLNEIINKNKKFSDLINFENLEDKFLSENYPISKNSINPNPYRILDAVNLEDDFYQDLIDWSNKNILAIGINERIFLWDCEKNIDLYQINPTDKTFLEKDPRFSEIFSNSNIPSNLLNNPFNYKISAVKWLKNSTDLAIGLQQGEIFIFDINKNKPTNSFFNHKGKIGMFSPYPENANIFSSASHDYSISHYDKRMNTPIKNFKKHSEEVCGIKWSKEGNYLATGGNDNKLIIWNSFEEKPLSVIPAHNSAIRALSWSNRKSGILATGGGKNDKKLKIWNVKTLKLLDEVETDSQICNVLYSKDRSQFITTHGGMENEINLWDEDSMEIILGLKGHLDRVIYLTESPDGESIATGAGDQSIKFWKVFLKERNEEENKCRRNSLTRIPLPR